MAVDGTYDIELAAVTGPESITFTLVSVGNVLNGTIDGYFGNAGFSGGRTRGGEISFRVELDTPVGKMDLEVEGKVDGDEITGQVRLGDFHPTPFSGTRA